MFKPAPTHTSDSSGAQSKLQGLRVTCGISF